MFPATMMYKIVCLFMFAAASNAIYYDHNQDAVRDPNATFILYDITAHKGGLDLKSALNQLKNVEYAFKVLGEDRAFFVVPDDNRCETFTADFSGFDVNAQPIRALNNSDVPASFNDTGLFIVTIHTSADVNELLSSTQQNCSECIRAFEVLGSKPKKYVLVGNIPLDQLDDIVTSFTPNQEDTATTKRVIDFDNFTEDHATSCIDVHKHHDVHKPVHVDYKPVHVDYKPVHVEHKPVKVYNQLVNAEHRPAPVSTSNGPEKSDSVRKSYVPKTPIHYVQEAPESPNVHFPKIGHNFYGQTEQEKIHDANFKNLNFPSPNKANTGYVQPSFSGFGVQPKNHGFDAKHPGFGLSLHDNPSARFVF